MEIKCNLNPNYLEVRKKPQQQVFTSRREFVQIPSVNVGTSADIYVRRPDAVKSASGLSGLRDVLSRCKDSILTYAKNYKKNIYHTYEHKMIFSLIEKELYGRNSIDSITHDLDKLILYALGFPKSFVSKFHREHSVHHVESGKNLNLKSMLCDNIASSPEFKPEKKYSLRKYYSISKELQEVEGFSDLLQKYNFGENIDFSKIKMLRQNHYKGYNGLKHSLACSLKILLAIFC